jgi:carboxypeptidase family protein
VNVVLSKSTGVVSGSVTAGGLPVSDVVVELSNGAEPKTTASASSPAGAYRFADVPPGGYTLTFRKPGLATQVVIVFVAADQSVTRDIDLTASP